MFLFFLPHEGNMFLIMKNQLHLTGCACQCIKYLFNIVVLSLTHSHIHIHTYPSPPKFNIAPGRPEDHFPVGNVTFQGPC